MAKKMNSPKDMREAKAPADAPEEMERLPTEKGYTRTKRKLKGTKNHEQELRTGKKAIEKPKQSGKLKSSVISQQLHQKLEQADQDDNIGVQSVNRSTQAAEAGAAAVRDGVQKIRKYGTKLHDRAAKPEVSAEKETLRHAKEEAAEGYKTGAAARAKRAAEKASGATEITAGKATGEASGSNVLSRFMQKRNIKQQYAAAKTGRETTAAAQNAVGSASATVKERVTKAIGRFGDFAKSHAGGIAIGGVFILLLIFLFTQMSSCSSMIGGSGGTLLGSSYTAEDEDIRGANADYVSLENALRTQINNIESTHSGYDEYRYNLDEINHNPYVLTSFLTVKYEDYTRSEVQGMLQALFDRQYELTLEEEVEIRTRTETREVEHSSVDPETGEEDTWTETEEYEVEYEYYILNVTLKNKTLEAAVFGEGMTDDERERYNVLLSTYGNRNYLFEDDVYANVTPTGDYLHYDIPGEALSDVRFARMVQEAEKYLGYPYVWGGSSPSTSFDCSGFVSWVINHCGNGWSYGRLTAEGLRNVCSIIHKSEAKPGDLIFFQGTYNTSGASHVGIYVGNGMMIHCGNVRPEGRK